jgi:thymidylate kinase
VIAIARSEPQRVKVIDATRAIEQVAEDIWRETEPLLALR